MIGALLLYGYGVAVGLLIWCAAADRADRLAAEPVLGRAKPRPHLIIAATGPLPDLERLRDALRAQRTPPGAITFAVEATTDPACQRIGSVFAGFPAAVSVVVAGLAEVGGQKSRNLAAALRTLGGSPAPIVLADADIVPQPDWLTQLVRPIAKGKAEIVTGYRWPVPLDARLPTLLAAWIDRALAGLPKPIGSHMIWGGSVALAPGVAERIALADRLEPEISDDLLLARLARAHRLRVRFQPAVLVPTPTRHGWRSLFGFGRRQYQMVRLYVPGAWAAWLLLTALNLAGALAALALMLRGGRALLAYPLLAGIAAATHRARARLAGEAGVPFAPSRAERALGRLALLLPLVHAVNLLLIASAVSTRTIRWGRCTYRLKRGRILAVQRRPW